MNESFGSEAEAHAAEHLARRDADSGALEEGDRCPDTDGLRVVA